MRTILVISLLACVGCPGERRTTSGPQTPNLACVPTFETLEVSLGANAAMFEMQGQLAALVPRLNCADVIANLRPPTARGTRIDPARRAALEAELALVKPRGIQIAGRDAAIFALKDNMLVFWPRDPMGGGGVPGGTVASVPTAGQPRSDIEIFVGGVHAQPGPVCAPCDPGSPNHPDCDTTPPTGPRGGGRSSLLATCTQEQCAQLIPIYCPAGDGGTTPSDGGIEACSCAASCCSQH